MGYRYLRQAAVALLLVACGTADRPAATISSQGALEPPEPPLPAALEQPPFAELSFVPETSEAVIRVDLAALADGDHARENALDFILRAQQPVAWETLRAAEIRFGRELRAIYLVVGPRVALAGSVDDADPYLLAGVGTFDGGKLDAALAASGAIVEPAPGAARIYRWTVPGDHKVGAALPLRDARLGHAALGVVAGLILVGPPELVRRAFAARAGEARDARRGPLARELVELDRGASAWGVAVAPEHNAHVSTWMPGLVRGRFHSSVAAARPGDVSLRAEFVDAERAQAFRDDLASTLGHVRVLADSSPVGAVLTRLREIGLRVDGTVVTTSSP